MKKIISLLATGVLALFLVGCGEEAAKSGETKDVSVEQPKEVMADEAGSTDKMTKPAEEAPKSEVAE